MIESGAQGDVGVAPRGERWVFGALIAIGVALRIAHLRQPMRHDEAYTFLHYASAPLSTALSDYTYPNNHLFHTLLVWLTTRVLGGSPEAIRLPAFVSGVLLLPAAYLLARRFVDRGAALIALGLAAAWPALVLYSTNARGYSIIALAFVALLLLGERALAPGSRRPWPWIGLVIAIGAYTAPVMLYPAGSALVWITVESRRVHGRSAMWRTVRWASVTAVLAGIVVLLAYLPPIAHSGLDAVVANRYVTPLTPGGLVAALPEFAGDLAVSLGLGIPLLALGALTLAAVAGIVAPGPDRARRISLAASVLGWCVLLLFVTRRPPPSRVWLFLVPLGCVYIGNGLGIGARWLARRAAPTGPDHGALLAVALAAAMSVWTLVTRPVFRSPETGTLVDAPEIARYLLATLRPGDRVVAASPCDVPLDYYLRRLGGRSLAAIDSAAGRGRVFVVVNPRHLQTLASVQAAARDVSWSELQREGGPVMFPPASVHTFRLAPAR